MDRYLTDSKSRLTIVCGTVGYLTMESVYFILDGAWNVRKPHDTSGRNHLFDCGKEYFVADSYVYHSYGGVKCYGSIIKGIRSITLISINSLQKYIIYFLENDKITCQKTVRTFIIIQKLDKFI